MTQDLIGAQQIGRRRKAARSLSGMMEQLSQSPAQAKRAKSAHASRQGEGLLAFAEQYQVRKKKKPPLHGGGRKPVIQKAFQAAPTGGAGIAGAAPGAAAAQEEAGNERRKWKKNFGKSVFSPRFKKMPGEKAARRLRASRESFFYSIAVFGGAVLFSLVAFLALNWDGIGSPLIPAGEDGALLAQMGSYAGFPSAERVAPVDDSPIPLDLMETFSWKEYTVQPGDTVLGLALSHGISMDAIIASNGIGRAKALQAGARIRIPNMDGIPYTVQKGDTLEKMSRSTGVPLEAILDANDLQSASISPGTVLFMPGARMKREDLKEVLGESFIYPIRGRLTSPFGWRTDPVNGAARRFHAALDLAAPTGTLIKAAMDGKVSTVGYNAVYGNFVILTHSRGLQTLYGHMSLVSVRQGSTISQGDKIGEVGSTGYSTGPHLHFGVYKNGRAVNPLEYLNPK